ncbi:dihydrofolate reductase family protein [Halobacillus salinus]|uniref:Dihydrofolate reductase n=1 Tax=Halobacillus salinus TaxID=192814 RepID=A0A4Z0H4J4_9BACI|nr:dihydrofolate reductase family protein [Halobacillus salinus]TGB05348.1 dihydrofolate reductase [Halobacillus salinus]
MGKVVLYIAQSLDGYICRENGEIDWLWDDVDYGFDSFFQSVDTVILGRNTYEQIFDLTEEFPYLSKDVYVVSRTQEGSDEFATFIQPEQMAPLTHMLKENGKTSWIVGGAMLIEQAIHAELIDEYQIFIQPTLIGRGISLFKANEKEHSLTLKNVRTFDDGMLSLSYTVND